MGVVLIIAIREISNRENEFDVNLRNIRPSKITRYTVLSEILKMQPHDYVIGASVHHVYNVCGQNFFLIVLLA